MRFALATTLVAVALTVAACGGGGSPSSSGSTSNGEASKSATQVVADAVKAAKAASSFHISGQIAALQGQQIALDLTLVKGKGATGSLTLQGNNVDLMIIGKEAYMKADSSFWTKVAGAQGAAIAPLVAGKWLKFPTSYPQFSSITAIANSTTLFNGLANNHDKLTNKGTATFNGQSVVAIYDASQKATLDVAATGAAYPVALGKAGTSGGTLTFDSWNKSVTLTAPSGAIDVGALANAGG